MDKSLQQFDNSAFGNRLTAWYEQNKRELPWRMTSNPYHIWISEIMLQQTKVDTVIDYYKSFIQKYPSIFDLAAADEEEVLKQWEGLGYYSRARNMHAAAQEVVSQYKGEIPDDPKTLSSLKGIGPYTTGAILSIAFDQPEPAVDGNVMRVLSRVLYIKDDIGNQRTRKRFERIVRELIKESAPSSFNQGLMELGAMICMPRKPLCLHCPVNTMCKALELGETENLPVKQKKKKQRTEEYMVLVIQDDSGRVAIEKRPEKGLLANMWQFPMFEKSLSEANLLQTALWQTYRAEIVLGEKEQSMKHVFTHMIWKLDVYHAVCKEPEQTRLHFVSMEELAAYPFSKSQQNIINNLKEKQTNHIG